jgi:uncharacterized protein YgbK (DUF1537 family)
MVSLVRIALSRPYTFVVLALLLLIVGPEIAPGVPVLRAVGGRHGDMLLALKSGNFGGPAFFSDALGLMR